MGKGAGAPRTQPYSSGVRQDVELDSALVDSLVEVADGEVICSQTMAAGIRDDDGSCFRPRHLVVTDTATNPSYPALMDGNLVAVSEVKGVMPSSQPAAVSLVPDILCVDSCVLIASEGRNTISVSTCPSNLSKSDIRESAESLKSVVETVAGAGAMQVVSGVHSKVTPLLGDIFVLAELLPSWLLLLQERTENVPTVLTQFECPWFVSALRLKCKLHSGIRPDKLVTALPPVRSVRRVFLVQGSRAFCLRLLSELVPTLRDGHDIVVAVFNGRPPVPMLSGLYGSRLKHSDVGGVTSCTSSVLASASVLNDSVSKPWLVKPMARFLVDLLKVDIPGASCSVPTAGPDPRTAVPLPSLLKSIPSPSVFSSTAWIRRRLLPSEFGLALDLPLDCLNALELALEHDASLAAKLTQVAPLKVLQSALTLLWPLSLGATNIVASPESLPERLCIAYVEPPAEAEADLRLAQSKATKSDDAKTNDGMWNVNAVTPPLGPVSWNGTDQSTDDWKVATGKYLPSAHGPLFAALRHLMLLRFRKNVRESGTAYLADKYTSAVLLQAPGLSLERDRDVDGVADCISRAEAATFWDWNGGSSPFFWRWQPEIQRDMRDGTPLFVTGPLPSNTRPQRMPANPSIAARIMEKVNKVRLRLYIAVGLVLSLTAYFHVAKGEDDIRMVYDLTASGLNEVLWAPSFWMPTIQNVLDCATHTSWFGDVDAGEMFLNYWLDPAIRPYAGVDVSWDTKGGGSGGKRWERWTRMAMGMLPSPWVTTRLFAWAMEFMKGDRRDPANPFHWSEVRMDLPGDPTYDCSMPRVYKWNGVVGCIACDCKTFVDDSRTIGSTRALCRACTHQLETRMSYLGLQDATRKKRDAARAPGEWTGTIQRAIPGLGVFATVSQKKWDKAKGYLMDIKGAFTAAGGSMPHLDLKELESKVGFFVHLAMTFPVMFPFLKGFYLTMNSWRPAREENGWKMSPRAYASFMRESRRGAAEPAGGGDKEDEEAPATVEALPLLLEHLDTLIELMSSEHPALRLIRGAIRTILEVLYIFGDASGAGFGASWTIPDSDAIGYRYGIWGREGHDTSSNYREFRNLVETLEEMGARGDLEGREIFIFTDNMVSESIASKGSSTSKALYELVVRVFKLEMAYRCNISFIHVAGTRMIAQGTDGLSRGEMYEGVMNGQPMLSFVPLHIGAVDRSPALLDWINSWAKEVRNEDLILLDPEGWFERGHDLVGGDRQRDGFWRPKYQPATMLWAPPPAAARQVIEELRQARQKRQTSMHVFACPRLMYDEFRRHFYKSADLVLTIEAGIYDWWPAEMHESLIIGIFFPYLSRCPWELRKTQLMVGLERKMRRMFKEDPASAGDLLSEFCRFTRRMDGMPVRVLRSVLSGRSRFAVPSG